MRPGPLFAVFVCLSALGAAPPKPLAIQNVILSQYEDGPALAASSHYLPGETVFLSFQVSGYRATTDDDPGINLEWQIEVKDPSGVPVIELQKGKIVTTLAQEDKNWMPKVRQTVQVPPYAPSGTYHISLFVKDQIAGAEVRKESEFQVKGVEIEPSPTLVIRNFYFYRGEEDRNPLSIAAYRPGDSVWIRFDITGYKFGDGNRIEVTYGITVLRPNGEKTFEQLDAAVERDQSFYPKRYVPAALSLTLPKDVRPGQYTVILSAADKVGNQTVEARQTFAVEQ